MKKYFKYAIGEILLVVIGILIALQINNANENRKNQDNINTILLQVRSELAQNIKRADELAMYYRKKDSLINIIMNNQLASTDISGNYDNPITDSEVMIVKDQGFENLMRNHSLIAKDLDSVVYSLKELYTKHKEVVEFTNNQMDKVSLEYDQWVKHNTTWYKNSYYKFDSITTQQKEFFLSPESPFKNFVYEYYTYGTQGHYSSIMRFRHYAYDAYKKLTKTLNITERELFSIELSAKQKQNIVGSYQWNDTTLNISEQDGKLLMAFPKGKPKELHFANESEYIIDQPENWLYLNIEYDKNGKVTGFTSRSGNYKYFWAKTQ